MASEKWCLSKMVSGTI